MARLKDRLNAAAGPGNDDQQLPLLDESAVRFANIPIEFIEPDPDQPRKDIGNVDELKASIAEHGVIQPIVVSPHGTEMFRIIAGERRFTAAKAFGLKSVPAIIRTVEEHRRLEVQLIENIHRKELSPIEEATTYKRLMTEFKLSQRQLAERLGKSAAAINQTVRILSLPAKILEEASHGGENLSRSVLLEIAKLETEEEQLKLFDRAKKGLLTVKSARGKDGVSPTPAPRAKYPIKTSNATVTVVFDAESATEAEIASALAEALKLARKNLASHAGEPT